MSTTSHIKCTNCGDENNLQAEICSSCGSKLDSSNIIKKNEEILDQSNKLENTGKQTKTENKKGKKIKAADKKTSKVLSKVKLVYFVFTLLILCGLVLVSSGTFDEPKATASHNHSNNFNQNDPHQGVDLSSLDRITQLEKDVTANPDDIDKTLELAHLLNDSGFHQKAIQYYDKYLTNFPDNPDVLVDQGVCYFELQDYNNAIDKMQAAIKINPTHQIAHFNLGIVNYSANNVAVAKEWWQKVVNLNPGNDIAKKAQELINNN